MNRVRTGELPWTKLDVLHRMTLDGLLVKFKIDGLSEDEKAHFNKVGIGCDAVARLGGGADPAEEALRHLAALERQHLAADQHGEVREAALGLHPFDRAGAPLQAGQGNLSDARRVLRPAAGAR